MKQRPSRSSPAEVLVLTLLLTLAGLIAKPNYDRYVAKARQSEARVSLAAIYSSEANYFASHGSYTYCLFEAGFTPVARDRFYLTGFTSNQENVGSCDSPAVAFGETFRTAGVFIMNRWANVELTWQGIAGDFHPTTTAFRAVAFGSIASDSPLFDIWSIDETKRVVHEQSGL